MWNFRTGGKTENPKDAGIKEFSKHIFESVVREATQNALDNRLDYKNPVQINFRFIDIPKNKIPGYKELGERWEACYKKWRYNDDKSQVESQYESLIKAILDRIDSFNGSVPCLSISDYNTKGMNFTSSEDIDKTRYGAFSRGNHSFHEAIDSAGSEGQGKAALYAVSALRTMFVHTVSEEGSIFEGLTRFATHEYNGEKYNSDGYYPHKPEKPEYEQKDDDTLYLPFRRKKEDGVGFGTIITLVGLWSYKNVEEKMIKSAINNFWMAILENDLIIKVGETTIDRQNMVGLIEKYLPERSESSRTKSNPTLHGRTKCYFETWTEKSESTEVYKENIPILGQCTLKISQHPDYPGKISFFRKQKMLIVRSSVNLYVSKGYCGVFICNDDDGNKILRKMEGKTHTEWDPNLCLTDDDKVKGRNAISELDKFVKESWHDYRSKHFPDTIELKGLAGLSFGNNRQDLKKTNNKNEKKPTPKSPETKPKADFVKLGVTKEVFNSRKVNGTWHYSLVLKANNNKNINVRMIPATDAIRISDENLLEVETVSDGWTKNKNIIEGKLNKGINTINFSLNTIERVALDFKLTANEN